MGDVRRGLDTGSTRWASDTAVWEARGSHVASHGKGTGLQMQRAGHEQWAAANTSHAYSPQQPHALPEQKQGH